MILSGWSLTDHFKGTSVTSQESGFAEQLVVPKAAPGSRQFGQAPSKQRILHVVWAFMSIPIPAPNAESPDLDGFDRQRENLKNMLSRVFSVTVQLLNENGI